MTRRLPTWILCIALGALGLVSLVVPRSALAGGDMPCDNGFDEDDDGLIDCADDDCSADAACTGFSTGCCVLGQCTNPIEGLCTDDLTLSQCLDLFNSGGPFCGDVNFVQGACEDEPACPDFVAPEGFGLELQKTVGVDPSVCADTTEITVLPGTTVTYCYKLTNTTGITLTKHFVGDDEFGSPVSGMFEVAPGEMMTHIITQTVGTEDIVNEAKWTGMATGFCCDADSCNPTNPTPCAVDLDCQGAPGLTDPTCDATIRVCCDPADPTSCAARPEFRVCLDDDDCTGIGACSASGDACIGSGECFGCSNSGHFCSADSDCKRCSSSNVPCDSGTCGTCSTSGKPCTFDIHCGTCSVSGTRCSDALFNECPPGETCDNDAAETCTASGTCDVSGEECDSCDLSAFSACTEIPDTAMSDVETATVHVDENASYLPSIQLQKTVTTIPGTCSTESSIFADPGDQVVYCYKLTNTSAVTLTLHTTDDDKLGDVLDGAALGATTSKVCCSTIGGACDPLQVCTQDSDCDINEQCSGNDMLLPPGQMVTRLVTVTVGTDSIVNKAKATSDLGLCCDDSTCNSSGSYQFCGEDAECTNIVDATCRFDIAGVCCDDSFDCILPSGFTKRCGYDSDCMQDGNDPDFDNCIPVAAVMSNTVMAMVNVHGDNCPDVENPGQENSDGDEHGDACDNCPNDDNQSQLDSDNDGLGDACDPCPNGDDPSNDGDGDGLCESGDEDHDGDGIPDNQDFDPTGCFYEVNTGEIVTGASISVNPAATIVDDGSADGCYQFTVTSPGVYEISLTVPEGCRATGRCPQITPQPFDPMGMVVLGSSEFGNTGFLADSSCSANPWALQLVLGNGNEVFNNNIPLDCRPVQAPVTSAWGMLALVLALLGISGLSLRRARRTT